MKSSQNKDKVLTLRVNHAQYEKICELADIREMNVTEYIRHTAIGNRIKPTVIEQIKESSEVSELFKKDNKALKSNNQALQHHIHQLKYELYKLRQENNIVETITETEFDEFKHHRGATSYHPKMMLKIVLYAYIQYL